MSSSTGSEMHMKEKFRDWNPRSEIKISYSDSSGSQNLWTADSQQLLNSITSIVESYVAQGIKLTSRQLYYQLVARNIIPNAEAVYKRICKFITDARYAGLIDWNAIEDRGRVPERHAQWDNITELVESAIASYRLPRWQNQDYYIELYTEKQALESVLKPIADRYHIFFGYNKGYTSSSPLYDLSKRIEEQLLEGKKVRILYLGDHDPSGIDMVRDIRKRVIEFLTCGNDKFGIDDDNLQLIHVGLTTEQVSQYNPPPNPAKMTDPRAKAYVQQFGRTSWELDSLPPNVLITITENAIKQFLNTTKYKAVINQEKLESLKLKEFAEKLSKERDHA